MSKFALQSLEDTALPCMHAKVLKTLHPKQRKQHSLSSALKGRIALFT